MRPPMRENTGISQQRSFWLRCFLGGAWLGLVVWLAAGAVWAKVEPAGPMHLWRVHGFFMSAAGKPISPAVECGGIVTVTLPCGAP